MFRLAAICLITLLSTQGYSMTYEEIKAQPKTVLRFTATWCPPCKALAPIFDEVAAEHPEMKTYVIDVDQNGDLAAKFGVKGIPTLIRLDSGTVKLQKSGARPKEEVEEFFE
jgi:thioredoxin 1